MHWLAVPPPDRSRKRSAALMAAALSCMILFLIVGCSDRPSVKVQASRDTVRIDLQTLGEYPTTISHVRLQNPRTKGAIWEVKTQSGTPQLRGLTFKVGTNPVTLAAPDSGTYKVVIPADSKVFQLVPGENYELEVWKYEQGSPSRVTIGFEQ